MDKGIIETDPSVMKLDYCIVINLALQKYIEEGISKLIGERAFIYSPKQGTYPWNSENGGNTFIIQNRDKVESLWNDKIYYDHVCKFSLEELPGCCGVLVSYHLLVHINYRNKGIAEFLIGVKERIAKDNGYTTIMATTIESNVVENHILDKYDYKNINSFKNKRTGNKVLVWMKTLE